MSRWYADGVERRAWRFAEDVHVDTQVVATSYEEALILHSKLVDELTTTGVAAVEAEDDQFRTEPFTQLGSGRYDDDIKLYILSGDECPFLVDCPIIGQHTDEDHEPGARCPKYAECLAPMPHDHMLVMPVS